jgi:ABC-type transport system substrate-binding protein/DNA-binding SARP family transcriptional activator
VQLRARVEGANLPELGAELDQHGLLLRELHAVRLEGVAPDLLDETLLVTGPGLEPAVTPENAVHNPASETRNTPLDRGNIYARATARGELRVRIFLAGRVGIETDGRATDEPRFAGRQGRLLFAYLVVEQGRPVPRDELAEALWGQSPPATWDNALRGLVSKLRELLRHLDVDGASALTGAFGCYRLELPAGTWVDVIAAADAVRAAETALGEGELEQAKTDAGLAASIARLPFLPGDGGDWVEARRRELGDVRARAAGILADAYLLSGDATEAATWAEQTVELAPFRESGYRRLMEVLIADGNRAEALRVYERCRRLLADELGAYPSPETESIYRGLLEPCPGDTERVAVHEAPPSLPEVLGTDRVRAGPRAEDHRGRRVLLAGATVLVLAVAGIVSLLIGMAQSGSRTGSRGAASLRDEPSGVAAVEIANGRPLGTTPLEAPPSGIAYGQRSVWVTMTDQDSVSRIDPKANAVQQTIAVGQGPTAIADADGFVWVANSLDGTVEKIDPRQNGGQVVDQIDVGNSPTGIAYGLGKVWVANSVDNTVQSIDPFTDKPGTPIPVDAGADAIAVGDGAVWVTSRASDVLTRVDPRSGTQTPINVGNAPTAVATGPHAVWVANSVDATLWRIDPATSRVVGAVRVGAGPSAIAVGPGGSVVWVSNALAGTLSKVDAGSGHVVESVTVGGQPQDVAASTDTAYVALQSPAGREHRGGTLTVAVPDPAASFHSGGFAQALDPASGGAWELLSLTNDGLVGYTRAGGAAGYRVVADLAAALPTVSNGGRTYAFALRPGIRYSTGALVRPADVRRGIERALLAVGGQSGFAGIVGAARCVAAAEGCDLSKGIVTGRGLDSVVIHLTAPDPDFLYKLALPDADVVPAGTPIVARVPLPATGPYEVARIDAARGVILLVRNPHFHTWSNAAQPDGFPDRIVERFGYTGASAVHAVETGSADITSDGVSEAWPPALSSTVRTRDSSRLYETPTMAPVGVWFNTRLPPFDDLRARQAVSYAVDRNHLVDLAGGPNVAQVGCQMLPPNVDGYRPFCPFTLHPDAAGTYNGPDLARARRLVTASGTAGQSVTVWFYDIPIGRRNGAYLVSVLRSIGYKAYLRLIPQTGSTWRPTRQAGVGGLGSFYPSANNGLSPYFTCSSYLRNPSTNGNDAEFCDRHIDAEISRARTLQVTDPTGASQLWTKIDRRLTMLAPWVVIRESVAVDLLSRRAHNYTPCWLSYDEDGVTGACLDQIWVR